MRALLLALPLSILTLFPGSGNAGDARPLQIAAVSDSEKVQLTNPNHETYRGYYLDLSKIAGRQDFAAMEEGLRRQLDNVESVGLNLDTLKFFHAIPIVIDEATCLDAKTKDDDKVPLLVAACYGSVVPKKSRDEPHNGSIWNSETFEWINPDPVALAEDTNRGVVLVRPRVLDPNKPALLHEMLHAYHARVMPNGYNNRAILFFYDQAKKGNLYPDGAYAMRDEREFFAVTASVFLSGNGDGGATLSAIQEKQPEYFAYLGWLFDRDSAPHASPVASAD
jgi:hypothetical protein